MLLGFGVSFGVRALSTLRVMMAACLSIACSGIGNAQTALSGLGASTCVEFGQLYEEDPSLAEMMWVSWMQGFMSGRNIQLIDDSRLSVDLTGDYHERFRDFVFFCNQNPMSSVFSRVNRVFVDLAIKQGVDF